MKRLIIAAFILTILILVFSGCGINGEKPQSTKDKDVLSQLNSMREQDKKPKEMFEYLNQNISRLDKETATETVGILVNTLEEYETSYNDQLFTGNNPNLMFQYFEFEFDYSKIEAIKEQELKTMLYDITLGGFKIVDAEGTFMVMVDYNALKTFDEYVNDELKSYIEIMSLSNSDSAAKNSSTMVGTEALENRIIRMEDYIKSFDHQQRKETMINMYKGYMMVYISGTDNAVVFDYDTGVINSDVFKVFETAAVKYKDAAFGKIINRYVELLKQENFIYTEKIEDFIFNIDTAVNEELVKIEKN